jgi:hypothetical protein
MPLEDAIQQLAAALEGTGTLPSDASLTERLDRAAGLFQGVLLLMPPDASPALSATSRVMYVATTGDDSTAAPLTSVTDIWAPAGTMKPYRSLLAACAQARAGQNDWVVVKVGSNWSLAIGMSA